MAPRQITADGMPGKLPGFAKAVKIRPGPLPDHAIWSGAN
jgi:hypothetical protein